MLTFEEAVTFLDSLGNDPQAVADSLRKHGIKGSHRRCDCPIANFLKKMGEERHVAVNMDHITVYTPGMKTVVMQILLMHHLPVSTFVSRFDSGLYSDLEEQP